jgi:hypothetical protein
VASFDPSILSQIPDMAGNPMEARAGAYKLADLMTRQQSNRMLLADQQRKQEEETQSREIYKKYADKLGTPEGNIEMSQAFGKAGLPQQAMESLRFGGEQQLNQIKQDEARLQALHLSVNMIGPAAKSFRETAFPNGQFNAQGYEQVRAAYKQQLQQIPEQYRGHMPPELPTDPRQGLQILNQGVAISDKAQELLDKEATRQHQAAQEKSSEELRNIERGHLQLDREKFARSQAGGGKAPAGYEWDPNNPDQLRYIKGGPKDPETTSNKWSGREKVFSQRVITAANEAAQAIENIVELPVGASTGVLGVGKSPGHSLYESTRDVLRNKMSSQEVQDYNTMLAGIRRNMAAIESTGLSPSGALTDSMAAVEWREGDSNLTKLRKLAEIKQITHAGLDVQLADPAMPEAIKDVARKALKKIDDAVPFTHQDLTKLEASPSKTINEVIKERGLTGGDIARPAAYEDPEKEKRYQEWKKRHGGG